MKIIVDEYNDFTVYNVALLDDNGTIITQKQGMPFDVAESYILSLIHSYKLPNDTLITDSVFNDDESLKHKETKTVGEFINM